MKEYSFKINGNDYTVGIDILGEKNADVVVNGTHFNVEIEGDGTVKKAAAKKPQVASAPASHPVANAATPATAIASTPATAAKASTGSSSVLSPLPGVILDIKVKEGDTVAVGQTLMILEAMKMENNIDSTFAGVVKSINVKCSDSVLEGDVLITIG
ncbi:MAG: biotin/lipoyl-containing protein [Rikenellaceae bacterium]